MKKRVFLVILAAATVVLSSCGATGGSSAVRSESSLSTGTAVESSTSSSSVSSDSSLSSTPEATPTPVPGILQVSTEEAAKMLAEETGYILVDARPAEDFAKKHIPGSINIPDETVSDTPPAELPDKDQRIFLYCGGGGLSYYLAVKLHDMGYTDLVKFAGMKEWTGPVEGTEVDASAASSSGTMSGDESGKDGTDSMGKDTSWEDSMAERIQPILMLDGSTPGETDGLSMKVTGFVPKETLTVTFVNNAKEERYTSPAFLLEYKEGGEWRMVPGMDELSFIEIAREIPPRSTAEEACDISLLHLDSGEYRITKSGVTAEFQLVYSE